MIKVGTIVILCVLAVSHVNANCYNQGMCQGMTNLGDNACHAVGTTWTIARECITYECVLTNGMYYTKPKQMGCKVDGTCKANGEQWITRTGSNCYLYTCTANSNSYRYNSVPIGCYPCF